MTPFWLAVAGGRRWFVPWRRLRRAWGWSGLGGMGWGVLVAAVVPSVLSMLTALAPVDVAALSSAVSAAAFCVGAVFSLACDAVRGVGLRLLLGCSPRLHGFCNGWHRQRRADHGRARDSAEQVVKGSFHSGASR